MAQSNPINVLPIPNEVISEQPVSQSQQLGFKEMKGFGSHDPDLLKNTLKDLDILSSLSTVLVRPKVIPLDDLTGWETESEYDICTVNGDVLFKVTEEADCCTRCSCGPLRPFNIYIKTPEGRHVIQLTRLLTVGSYLCTQFNQKILVYSPPNRLIGTVERKSNVLVPKFVVKNNFKEVEHLIRGPYCTFSCCGDVDYLILTPDRASTVGKVSKQWSGIYKEAFTKTEYFGVEWPLSLDLEKKIRLLAGGFLIDHIYFDH